MNGEERSAEEERGGERRGEEERGEVRGGERGSKRGGERRSNLGESPARERDLSVFAGALGSKHLSAERDDGCANGVSRLSLHVSGSLSLQVSGSMSQASMSQGAS
jgi:hypothetical protein